MDLQQRRIKVIEKMLDNTINEQIAHEIGIEAKEAMLLRMGDHPLVSKVEEALRQEKMELEGLPAVIEILNRKLEEANGKLLS